MRKVKQNPKGIVICYTKGASSGLEQSDGSERDLYKKLKIDDIYNVSEYLEELDIWEIVGY